MLHQGHIRVEIGNPLLALLGDSKIAQSIQNIGLHHLPEKMRVIRPQIILEGFRNTPPEQPSAFAFTPGLD